MTKKQKAITNDRVTVIDKIFINELKEFIQWYSDKKDWYEGLNADSGIIITDYQEFKLTE